MSMARLLDSEFCLRLMFTMLHFIWQGVAIALAAMAACVLLRRAGASVRYWVLVASMVAMAICPVATFFWMASGSESSSIINESGNPAFPIPTHLEGTNAEGSESLKDDISLTNSPTPARVAAPSSAGVIYPLKTRLRAYVSPETCRHAAPWVAVGYFAGLFLMLARLLLALGGGRGLRSQSRPVTETAYLASLERAAKALGSRAMPAVAWCERVAVPTVVGLLKPTILLPMSLVTGLSTGQVEMMLLHELAHLRRHDHWVNLAQWVIETALFFNPAVWIVSRRLRVERELACDDLVLAAGVEKASYADSLLRMAEISRHAVAPEPLSALALGSHGPRRSGFGRRVLRLIEGRDGLESLRPARLWPLGVAVVVVLTGGIAIGFRSHDRTESHNETASTIIGDVQDDILDDHADAGIEFSNGIRAQVLGVASHPRHNDECWAIDGRILTHIPKGFENNDVSLRGENKLECEFYLRYINLPASDDIAVICQAESSSGSSTVTKLFAREIKMRYVSLFPKGNTNTNLRLGVATGPWEKVIKANESSGQSTTIEGKPFSLFLSQAFKDGATIRIVVSTQGSLDGNVRFVAFDESGNQYVAAGPSGTGVGDMNQSTYEFKDVPLDVKLISYEFQSRDYEWREIKDIALEPKIFIQPHNPAHSDVVQTPSANGENKSEFKVQSVQVVPVKDKTWALVVRADNPISATQYLGVDIYANLNRFLGGATHRAEISTLVPGFSGDLRREFQLVQEPFGISRPNDVHIQVARTNDDQYYLQDDIRFLPPDAEIILDTRITLPTEDGKERILFKSHSNEAFDYPTFPTKRKADTRQVSGHVTEDGLPAPGKRVLIVEDYDSVLHETVSDAEGAFVFNLTSPNSLGVCVYWAEGGEGRVSPLGISHKWGQKLENLSLGAPAVLEGNVVDAINQPLGGVTVIASPDLSSGYRKTVTTDALGAYRIELPPYPNGYQLSASLAGYYQPYKPFNDKAITAKAGEISRQNLTMHLSARLEGKVIGPQGQPAADALITWQAYPTPLDVRETTTTTGQRGQFTLTTGHVGEWLELRVSSKRWGNAKQGIEVPLEGETLADIVIQTPGSVNLKGRVLDPSGQPVRNMRVFAGRNIQNPYTQTDADGRFAFTGVSLPQKGNTIQIGVIPPRPEFTHHQRDWKTGEIPPRVEAILRRPIDRQRTWYQQKFIDREGQPGESLDVTIHLEPAQVITFSGTVRDQNGQPVPNAELTLFAGTPDLETWMAQMYPFERSLMTGGGPNFVMGPMRWILTSCLADEEGRYTLSAIRENVNPSVLLNPPRNAGVPNPEEFSIGVGKGYQNAKLITGLSLPLDEDQRQVDIDLPR